MRIKTMLILVNLFFFINVLNAAEFEVKSFNIVPEDLAAIKYSKTDINGITCAIIKVYTDLRNLSFNTNIGIVDVKYEPGEYWIYVSPGEQRIKFIKEEFIPFSYDIPLPIESKKVYKLVLTKKNKFNLKNGKGTVSLKSNPSGAFVSIDGFPDVEKKTPCTFEEYRTGQYLFRIYKNNYFSKDTLITINKNEEQHLSIELKPKWGALKLTSNNKYARFFLNGKYIGKGEEVNMLTPEKAPLLGNYEVEVRAKNYYTQKKNIEVRSSEINTFHFKLEPKVGSLWVNSNPKGVSIYLDDDFIGTTPLDKRRIKTGFYKLELKGENILNMDKIIEIKEGETTSYSGDLEFQKSFTFYSEPSGAKVFIDNKYEGITPLTVKLALDNYRIKLSKDLYQTDEFTIEVSDYTSKVNRDLIAEGEMVTINSKPSNGRCYVDGDFYGYTPQKIPLKEGRYRIKIFKKGYETFTKTISVNAYKEYSFSLKSKKRLISIRSNPSNAKCFIDGRYEGRTPLEFKLSKANAQIKIVKDGYETYVVKVDSEQKSIYKKLVRRTNKKRSRISKRDNSAKSNYMSHYYGVGYVNGLNAQGGYFTLMGGHVLLEIQMMSIAPYNGERRVDNIASENYIDDYASFLAEDGYIATNAMGIIDGYSIEAENPSSGGAYLLKAGYLGYSPFPFSLNVGYGKRGLSDYYQIYRVTNDFEDSNNNQITYGTTIAQKPIAKEYTSFSLGSKVLIPFTTYGGLQAGADYWLDSEQGRGWVFNIGIYFYPGED